MTTARAGSSDRLSAAEVREIAAGGAAVLGLAVVLTLSYSGMRFAASGGSSDYEISAIFNRVDGLAPGAEVQLSGVPIGRVDSMTLLDTFRVRLGLRIDKHYAVPADTSAAIQTDGLFGSKSVALEPGGADESLPPGGVITFTQDSVVVSELLDLIINEGRAIRSSPTPGE